ncbi:MAG: hypothetical protein LBV55_00540 [Acholeplasmatales bacterium]|nr:hypothetical protein [Acholeplasmatales bacterium]
MERWEIFDKSVIIYGNQVHDVESILTSKLFYEICQSFLAKNTYLVSKLNFVLTTNYFIELTTSLFLDKDIYKSSLVKENRDYLYDLYNALYDYWRSFKRYCILSKNSNVLELSKITDNSNLKILTLYRKITERLKETKYLVYRKLPAFCNAIFSTMKIKTLKDYNVQCLNKILISPPFIINTKVNKRISNFIVTKQNILNDILLDDNFLAYQIYVGKLKTIIYFHKKYSHHIISLAHLYEAIDLKKRTKNFDIVLFLGVKSSDNMKIYQDDKPTYYGILSDLESNDYFGYVKKILLTMHNLIVIDHKKLPIHGCGFEIEFTNGKKKNIVLVGDSGVGKSETLANIRSQYARQVSKINIIFDDMGYLILKDQEIYFSGTEIGAFVRLDDLDPGWAYDQIDRSIFINPNKINARIVMPINDYKSITAQYPLSAIFYVNNYDSQTGLYFFNDLTKAIETFTSGWRLTKGTTNEQGLVSSFFANPFGPLQRQAQTTKLIKTFFPIIFKKYKIGILYSNLGLTDINYQEALSLTTKALIDYIEEDN